MTKEKKDDTEINRLVDVLEKMNNTLSENNKELIRTLESIEYDLSKIKTIINDIYLHKL
jgi:septation ring formation regulator EzrA